MSSIKGTIKHKLAGRNDGCPFILFFLVFFIKKINTPKIILIQEKKTLTQRGRKKKGEGAIDGLCLFFTTPCKYSVSKLSLYFSVIKQARHAAVLQLSFAFFFLSFMPMLLLWTVAGFDCLDTVVFMCLLIYLDF